MGERYQTVNDDEMELFASARKVLVVPFAFILLFGLSELCSAKPREQALVTCGVVLFEFGVQITYYTLLSIGWGFPFQNQRSSDHRPIYATRWVGWFFGIPTLIFMNLYPIVDDRHVIQVLARLCPQMAASATYCWTCFLGCVVLDPWTGLSLEALGCVAYIMVVIDEVYFVSNHLLNSSLPAIKGYSIIMKEFMFGVYTAVWLMGNGGFVSSYMCQRFYTVSDVSLKAIMASLMCLYFMFGGHKSEAERKDL
eukprot:Skav233165  [mRNA]  locus=scaffold1620:79217:79975:- [translate_table: standard]